MVKMETLLWAGAFFVATGLAVKFNIFASTPSKKERWNPNNKESGTALRPFPEEVTRNVPQFAGYRKDSLNKKNGPIRERISKPWMVSKGHYRGFPKIKKRKSSSKIFPWKIRGPRSYT
jgi:hypothetical protein